MGDDGPEGAQMRGRTVKRISSVMASPPYILNASDCRPGHFQSHLILGQELKQSGLDRGQSPYSLSFVLREWKLVFFITKPSFNSSFFILMQSCELYRLRSLETSGSGILESVLKRRRTGMRDQSHAGRRMLMVHADTFNETRSHYQPTPQSRPP
ncbi:hypothetical protein E4T56_gene10765 [Termitomyces sp. T112]|nr:hypothetical protein E4T56_gene10765 [Termitomyces sp. T112]